MIDSNGPARGRLPVADGSECIHVDASFVGCDFKFFDQQGRTRAGESRSDLNAVREVSQREFQTC